MESKKEENQIYTITHRNIGVKTKSESDEGDFEGDWEDESADEEDEKMNFDEFEWED